MTFTSVPSYATGRYFAAACLKAPGYIDSPDIFRLPLAGENLFAATARRNGYETVIVTTHPMLQSGPFWNSFDERTFVPPPKGQAYAPFERALEKTKAVLANSDGKPFLLYLHVLDVHFPHILSAPYDKWLEKDYKTEEIEKGEPKGRFGRNFSKRDKEQLGGMYDGSILYADECVGRVIQQVTDQGLLDNTLFVISSDHGDLLGEDGSIWGHFGTTADEILHVPFILCGPGLPSGKRVTALTENVDIVPTIADILDWRDTSEYDGKSLVSLVDGRTDWRNSVQVTDSGLGRVIGVRTPEYKYLNYYKDLRVELWSVPDSAAGRKSIMASRAEWQKLGQTELDNELEKSWKAWKFSEFGPATRPIYLMAKPGFVFNRDAIAVNVIHEKNSEAHEDKRWEYAGFESDGFVWSNASKEDAPPLILDYDVPPGSYKIEAQLLKKTDMFGRPASKLKITIPAGTNPRIVSADPQLGDGYVWVDLGQFVISDRSLRVVVDEAEPGYWAYFRGLRLTPTNEADDRDKSVEESTQEQLRALGYVE